mgnify:CR=1 FL=1
MQMARSVRPAVSAASWDLPVLCYCARSGCLCDLNIRSAADYSFVCVVLTLRLIDWPHADGMSRTRISAINSQCSHFFYCSSLLSPRRNQLQSCFRFPPAFSRFRPK